MRFVLAAAAVGALLVVPGGAAHRDPCHPNGTCPSDHHSYVWHGLSCTSYADERLAADTRRVAVGGRVYWCHGSNAAGTTKTTALASRPLARVTRTRGCRARGPLPDRRCTPGAVFAGATAAQVCTSGWSSRHRDVSAADKRAVYAAYGIRAHRSGGYEVDHLVALELGGSNDLANLFPEAASPRPGFHEKDRLEDELHRQVCAGLTPLAAAQRGIARNWVVMYERAFG